MFFINPQKCLDGKIVMLGQRDKKVGNCSFAEIGFSENKPIVNSTFEIDLQFLNQDFLQSLLASYSYANSLLSFFSALLYKLKHFGFKQVSQKFLLLILFFAKTGALSWLLIIIRIRKVFFVFRFFLLFHFCSFLIFVCLGTLIFKRLLALYRFLFCYHWFC